MPSARALLLLSLLAMPLAAQQPPTFNRDVRPILSQNCYRCHGPDGNQRKAGLRLDRAERATAELASGHRAIVRGDPARSRLLERVRSDDPEFHMPPPSTGKRLTPAQIDVLQRWIAAGAEYEPHWSFVAPRRPAVPVVADADWPRNPIDAFVLARCEREGLRPSPPADRATLLRRITLDVTGLPPTPEEIDAFLADDSPNALETVLDRLFASPRHGEHMARYWLDAARYGDTHGYHLDNVRSLWPWRDWVIAAFGDNMPFDQFTVEQLAGDLLPDATRSQLVATGFNRCNPTTGEGGLIAEEYLVKYAVDRVDTTATVWMGLTAACAQCHDHKFDPLTQREYYGLFDFFHSFAEQASDENALTPKPALKVPSTAQEAGLARLEEEVAALRARLDAPDPELDRAQALWEAEQTTRLDGRWHDLRPTSALSRGGATLRIEDDHSVVATGHSPERDVYEIVARSELRGAVALRLEALRDHEGLGPGRASHANIVLSRLTVESAPAGAPLNPKPVAVAAATADFNQRDFDVGRSLDADPATGWAFAGPGRDHDAVFAFAEPLRHEGGTLLRVRVEFTSGYPHHTLRRLRLSVAADPRALPVRLGTWHAIGPFPAESARAAHDTDFGPETNADPTASCGGLSWSEKPEWNDGAAHALPGKVGATYLQRVVHSPDARPLRLALGSDDSLKLWRNGELVMDRDVARPVAPDQDAVTVWLQPGENRLLWKIANHGGDHGFYFRVAGEDVDGLPAPLGRALAEEDSVRTDEHRTAIRAFYRRHFSPEWKALEQRVAAKAKERADLDAALPRTMVVTELDERRPTHLLVRGQYDDKGDAVPAGVPAFLPALPEGVAADRLALARWLVSPEHPLTARVSVNRLWQQVFGTGIVKTTEDFGSQGEWPSHQDLLDWLAVELVESGWDLRHVLRLMLTSATYAQDSRPTPDLLARDPGNRLYARGPRFRLDAEAIRDQALFVSGLLVEKVGGPSVKPYQPPGIWEAVGYVGSNTQKFEQEQGEALWRRSLYTFWKRTAPPPTMSLFDAPSRESCTVRRARTNTPLQALVLLNDVQFVEAARHLGARMLRAGGEDDARLACGFRLCAARLPAASELQPLLTLLRAQRRRFTADPDAAAALLAVGDSPVPAGLDTVELAAFTLCANVLLNLDETLTKG